jgi:hypothetical protein
LLSEEEHLKETRMDISETSAIDTIAPGLIDTPIYGSGDRAEAMKRGLSKVNGETIRVDGAARLGPR